MLENQLSFEKAFSNLQEIAEKLNDNKLSLEESLKLFEEGVKLSKYCNEVLSNAREKIDSLQAPEVE